MYFETIHPFEDGNGRIGRVLADKALSQTLGRPVMLSLSRKIEAERKKYYHSLETAQKSNDIKNWVRYFVQTIVDAQIETRHRLEAGPDGFEGGITAKKYMSITKTSKATATRDLQHLAEIACLVASGGGRSTSYRLTLSILSFLSLTFPLFKYLKNL